MANKHAACIQKRRDCFAYLDGGCTVLTSGVFNKPCPFYKTKRQFDEDLEKYPYNPTLHESE